MSTDSMAGNRDRSGQAGASELLINHWGRSAGLHGMNSSFVQGLEAMRSNVAGMAFLGNTEIIFANTAWLQGSGVNINGFGLAQRVGESSVLGINVVSVGFGEIITTTELDPEGELGATFKPQLLNLGLAYAQSFSNSIHVGALFRVVNESIQNVSASGFALDVGIQYVTGPRENIRFGIALRNVGTPMRYSGDGLSIQLQSPQGYNLSLAQKSEKFELPTMLNMGASYDFQISEEHRLTAMGNFTSNSFINDYFGGGVEYAFKEMFMLRAGYRYEEGIFNDLDPEQRASAYTGLSAGMSVDVPLREDGPRLGVDYAYRTTNPYGGTHTIGVRINL